MSNKEIIAKTYEVKAKGVQKAIQKAVKRGYDEFTDLLTGKMTFEKFVSFVDGMGMSEVENAAEAKTANILREAVTDLGHHLLKTEQITQEEHDALENAALEIPYDDSI